MNVTPEDCCNEWQKARMLGTDGNGDNKLIHHSLVGYIIGMNLQCVNFCPWCGAKKESKSKNNERRFQAF